MTEVSVPSTLEERRGNVPLIPHPPAARNAHGAVSEGVGDALTEARNGIIPAAEATWDRTVRESVAALSTSEDTKEGSVTLAEKHHPVWKAR